MIMKRQKHYVQFLFLCVSDKSLANGSEAPHILCVAVALVSACVSLGQRLLVHKPPQNPGLLVKGDNSKERC